MVMLSDSKLDAMRTALDMYVQQVNNYRTLEKYDMANDYFDMLMGALQMYNIVVSTPLEVIERNREVELIDSHLRR